jgi:hypothetical protein
VVFKLIALYGALKKLGAAFPQVEADAKQLWSDAESAIVNRSWTLAAAEQVAHDGGVMVTDFLASWDGGADPWNTFKAAFLALFTK